MKEKSTTADEIAHITGGFTFNHWKDFRLHPENGILPQRWQTLPLTWTGANYPALTDEAWAKSNLWLIGYRFFYQSGNNHERMLASARAMNALFGAATTLLVFFWSYRLWGTAGALISAITCALCPTMLAQSGVATSDMCMTFFFLLSIATYWHHLHHHSWGSWILSAAVFGLATVAKHSAVLLFPLALLMALVRVCDNSPWNLGSRTFVRTRERLGLIALSFAVHGLIVAAVIWAWFGFRYTAFNPDLPQGDFTYPWAEMLSFGGIKAQAIEFFKTHHLLPEGYLYGLSFVLKLSEMRGAFLDGDYSVHGWVSFFPKAFLYKTPPSLLLAVIAGIALLAVRARTATRAECMRGVQRSIPLLVLFATYWGVSLASHLNIGHRHLLPIYPVLYILCGALGWAATRAFQRSRFSGWGLGLVITLFLFWHATITAAIHPHYLAYFSPVVGGPTQGYKHLVDSSLDWGQDLPGLSHWLQVNQRSEEPLYLSYFGTGEPDYYNIRAVRMAMLPNFDSALPWYACKPGLFAISATMLQQVYTQQRGPWTLENENRYQNLRLNEARFLALEKEPESHPELLKDISIQQWKAAWELYAHLRFARLCHYLRARQPDGMAGYSILIYRLDQSELDAALNGNLRDLSAAMERAMTAAPKPMIID